MSSGDEMQIVATKTCPTCKGTGVVSKDYWSQDADDCPDCEWHEFDCGVAGGFPHSSAMCGKNGRIGEGSDGR